VSYLLRVLLPDRPGSLGALATALGRVGADIVSLDVVESGPEGAVDDILVELPPAGLADVLITAAQSVPGVAVESLRPHSGGREIHRDLDLVDALAADRGGALATLTALLPGVFRAGWALLVVLEPGRRPRVQYASSGAPETAGLDLPWLPLPAARRVEPAEQWVPAAWRALGTALVAAPAGPPQRAVLLGRPGGPQFRNSEVLRLAHLAGIAATVTALPLDPPGG
jgi:hypothetical protein